MWHDSIKRKHFLTVVTTWWAGGEEVTERPPPNSHSSSQPVRLPAGSRCSLQTPTCGNLGSVAKKEQRTWFSGELLILLCPVQSTHPVLHTPALCTVMNNVLKRTHHWLWCCQLSEGRRPEWQGRVQTRQAETGRRAEIQTPLQRSANPECNRKQHGKWIQVRWHLRVGDAG